MPESKPDIGSQYQNINELRRGFRGELEKALESGDPTLAINLRTEIERRLSGLRKEIKDVVDPFRVELRDQIAREKGYEFVGVFSPVGLAKAHKGDQHFYVDTSGKDIYGPFEGARDFVDGLSVVKANEHSYLFNESGQFVGDGFKYISTFSDGYAHALKFNTERAYYINKSGKEVRSFDEASSFKDGFSCVKVSFNGENDWIMMNKSFEVFGPKFDRRAHFSEGLAEIRVRVEPNSPAISYASQSYFVDTSGNIVLPKKKIANKILGSQPYYYQAGNFSEGLAWIINGDDRGFINKDGKLIISYDKKDAIELSDFSEGFALISRNGSRYFIDRSGRPIKDGDPLVGFRDGRSFQEGVGALAPLDRWYFIDKQGNQLNSEGFDEIIHMFYQGVAKVEKNGETFYIDKKMRRVFNG